MIAWLQQRRDRVRTLRLQQYLDRVRTLLQSKKLMATVAPQTHNTPPVALDDLPPSSEPSAVPFFWQLPSNLERKALPPVPKVQRTCLVCMDKLDEDLFPYKCTRCSAYSYCRECLKSWFLDACRNESKMPPKCCSVIPVSSVTDFLTMDQVSRSLRYLIMTDFHRLSFSRPSTRNGPPQKDYIAL